jgi:hypothetical protein
MDTSLANKSSVSKNENAAKKLFFGQICPGKTDRFEKIYFFLCGTPPHFLPG